MILVDIEVAADGKQYDFKLDENVYIGELIDEIGAMIVSNLDKDREEKIKDMLLCDQIYKRILPMDCTLKQCGIGSGWRLVLI